MSVLACARPAMSSVEGLGPDASVQELKGDLVFYEVLLSTLDVDADDFLSKKQEYEEYIQQLNQWLAAKPLDERFSPHRTPSRSPSLSDVTGSASLPSRSRPAAPLWSEGSFLSPSNHRFGTNMDGSGDYDDDPTTTRTQESTNGLKKRARNDTASSGPDNLRKILRTSESLSGSASSRPISQESAESFLAGNLEDSSLSHAFLQKYIKEEEEREKRRKQEQADAEFARQIQDNYTMGNSAFRPSTQSLLDRKGDFERSVPSPAPLPSFAALAYSGGYPTNSPRMADSSRVKVEPQENFGYLGYPNNSTDGSFANGLGSNNPSFSFPQASSKGNQYLGSQNMSHDDGSDDLEIISPDQFRARVGGNTSLSGQNHLSQSLTHPDHSALQPLNSLSGYDSSSTMPGGFPLQPADPVNFDFSSLQYPPMPSSLPWHGPLAPPMPSMMNSTSDYNLQSGYTLANGLANGQVYGSAGSPGNSGSDSEGLGSGQNDNYDALLRARGLESLRHDSSKTHEEIKALVENIRPDEDLPEELREGTPPDLKVRLMAHQQLGLGWLKKQEDGSNRGGILADDMGLGKTIQALSLILERKSTDPAVKTTLIIAPVALMRQWQREIETRVKPHRALSVHVYHGSKKNVTYSKLKKFDVVLTTFGTLAAEHKRKQDFEYKKRTNPFAQFPREELSLLGDDCEWYRIIIDEAQNIKNKAAKTSVAATVLRAKYRLCMTGTPMMNNVSELYSLIRFLRIPPYNDEKRFNNDFAKPLRSLGDRPKDSAMKHLQALLKAILLRRTKESKIDGKNILTLPPRVQEIKHAVFDSDQRDFYNALEQRTQLRFNRYLQNNTIGKNYSNILVLLLRLRQACCHPQLIKDHSVPIDGEAPPEEMESLARNLSEDVVNRIKETDGAFECPICYDASDNPTIFFPCGHDVCAECFGKITDPTQATATGDDRFSPKCPECRETLDPRKIIRYNVFKKVHLGELGDSTNGEDLMDVESDSQDDSDSDDDDDSQGDLDDFIVPDDQMDESDASYGNTKVENRIVKDEIKSDTVSPFKTKIKSKPKAKARPKGKGKAKKETRTLAELKKEGMRNAAARRKYMRRLRKNFETSAKIDKTVEILKRIHEKDNSEKTIIFSQFTSMLDLLEIPMEDLKFNYGRYDGAMNPKQRNAAVEKFTDDPTHKIMLVSLKAGNAGLNLNVASQVIILDPFWNPFIEEQAIDRAHRIGQTRPVNIHRLLIENTVEDRIIDLQEKKRNLINRALDETASKSLSRLGRRELAYLFVSEIRQD